MTKEGKIVKLLTWAIADNDFGRIRITIGPVSMSVRPVQYYADKKNPSVSEIKVRGGGTCMSTLDDLAQRIIDLACDYDINDIVTELPGHVELCGSSKKYDRAWNPDIIWREVQEQEDLKRRIAMHGKAMSKLSTSITPQKEMKNKEKLLQELVKVMPITIEYGCHAIELKYDPEHTPFHLHGYSFRAVENDGKGLKIVMH